MLIKAQFHIPESSLISSCDSTGTTKGFLKKNLYSFYIQDNGCMESDILIFPKKLTLHD